MSAMPLLRKIEWAGLAAALAAGILVFTIRVPDAYGIPKLVAVCAALLVVWTAALFSAGSNGRFKARELDLAVLGCFAATALATFLSEDPYRSVSGAYVFFINGLLPVSLYTAAYFAARRCAAEEALLPVLRAALGAGGLCGLYAALQGFGIEPILPAVGHGSIGGRTISTLGGPIYLGSALIPLAPLGLHFLLEKRSWDRILGGIGSLLIWAGILGSVSRGALIGAMAGCLFAWLASRRELVSVLLSRRGMIASVSALIAFGGLLTASAARGRSAADRGRVEVWKIALRVAGANPVFGIGPGGFETGLRRHRSDAYVALVGPAGSQADAHNDVLHVAATTGAAGLLAYGFLLFALVRLVSRALARDGPERGRTAAFAGAALGLFVQAKVNPVSFVAILTMAVFAGFLEDRGDSDGRAEFPARAVSASFAVLCAAALLLAGQLLRTDSLRQVAETARAKGDMDTAIISYRAAIRGNPFYSEYGSSYGTLLGMLVERAPEEVRKPLAEEMFKLAGLLKRRHPKDVRGPHLYGAACLIGGPLLKSDCLDEAWREMELAYARDPYSLTVLRDAAEVARRLGRDETASAFDRRLAYAAGLRSK
jgi:O-antigen ligase